MSQFFFETDTATETPGARTVVSTSFLNVEPRHIPETLVRLFVEIPEGFDQKARREGFVHDLEEALEDTSPEEASQILARASSANLQPHTERQEAAIALCRIVTTARRVVRAKARTALLRENQGAGHEPLDKAAETAVSFITGGHHSFDSATELAGQQLKPPTFSDYKERLPA
jgi:hypothetical protein